MLSKIGSINRRNLLKTAAVGTGLAIGMLTIMKKANDYRVAKGDTLSGIAAKHGTTWQQLARLNNLNNPHRLAIGQRIRLRPQPPAQTPAPRPVAQPVPRGGRPTPRPVPAVAQTPATRFNYIANRLHTKLNNPNLEAAVLANFNAETGGRFDHNTRQVGGSGHGIPQYTGPTLRSYRAWLRKGGRTDSAANQIDYFVDEYMPTRAGYRTYMAPGAAYTREQYADWLHRRVFTPAHTIRSHKGYSPAMIAKRTRRHNDFMRNNIKAVNGVWQGVGL